jgi:thymidylate synthase (FAD)
MIIIDQYAKILEPPDFNLVERAGRTCYKSEDKIDPMENGSVFTKNIIKRNHLAMVEFASMTVLFVTDRGVSHELVRHRLCSFAQESTRYCNYKTGISFVRPSTFNDWPDETKQSWESCMLNSELCYIHALRNGLSPQQARCMLPNSLKTEIVIKANMREWLHIFELRCASDAHPDMQALMRPLQKEVYDMFPWLNQ